MLCPYEDFVEIQSRQESSRRIAAILNDDFDPLPVSDDQCLLPQFRHRRTQLLFRYVPRGEFRMGLSDAERMATESIAKKLPLNSQEMRPVHSITIDGFLLSTIPVTTSTFKAHSDRPSMGPQRDSYPVFVGHEQASAFASKYGLRLPSEPEWEYACRAMTETLFVWGNSLPSDNELSQWLSLDLSDNYQGRLRANRFGLYCLFSGEWCSDFYKRNYSPDVLASSSEHVVRGGGAIFWPWQDQEWVWCMSAMRMPETNLMQDKQASFRLAFSL